jgi:ribosomal protein L6P/L9E
MTHIGKASVQLTRNTHTLFHQERNTFVCIGRLGIIEITLNAKFMYTYSSITKQLNIRTFIENFSQWGLLTALTMQVYVGLYKGFMQRLELHGLGFKCSVRSQHMLLKLGFSHTLQYKVIPSVTVACKTPTTIVLKSILARDTKLVAYQLHLLRKPDVYKQRGITIVGTTLIKKPGKKKK